VVPGPLKAEPARTSVRLPLLPWGALATPDGVLSWDRPAAEAG
jgi:hypothetical protein